MTIPEGNAALAALGGRAATDELIAHIAETVLDRAAHEHPAPGQGEDLYCLNLTSWMGERMGGVLVRLRDAEAERDAALAEAKQTASEAEKNDRALNEALKERDDLSDLLDWFAATVAPTHVIGEHSSANDPWLNALELVTPAAKVERLRAERNIAVATVAELARRLTTREREHDADRAVMERLRAEVKRRDQDAARWRHVEPIIRRAQEKGCPYLDVDDLVDAVQDAETGADDGTCGDCATGKCHGTTPDDCGCDRHNASTPEATP